MTLGKKREQMKLDSIKPKQTVEILEILDKNITFRKKVTILGLRKGKKVTVIRNAPLGDPMEVKVENIKILIRKNDASKIEVKNC